VKFGNDFEMEKIMFRRLFFLLTVLLIPLGLASCAGEQPTAPADTAESSVAAPTVEPALPEPPRPSPTAITGPQMECTMVSDQPEASAELEAILGVKENDWVYGPETAAVTIVEYADFQ